SSPQPHTPQNSAYINRQSIGTNTSRSLRPAQLPPRSTPASSQKSSQPSPPQAPSTPQKTAQPANPAASSDKRPQPGSTEAVAPATTQQLVQQASPAAPGQQPPAMVDRQNAAPSAPIAQTTGQTQKTSEAMEGDAAAGRQVFRKCQACHSMEPAKNMLGPSLAGLIGRKAGSESGYNYSQAMKQTNITWDAKTLDAYLADPQKTVPGNKMPFPGLKTDHDRADIIAFLAASAAGQPGPTVAQQGGT